MKLTKKFLAIVMALGLIAVMSAMAFAAATDTTATATDAPASAEYNWVLHENSIYQWIKKGSVTHCDIVKGKNNTSYNVSVETPDWAGVVSVTPKEYASLKEGQSVWVSSYYTGIKQIVLTPKTGVFFIDVIHENGKYYAVFNKNGEEVLVKSHKDIGGYGNPLGTDAKLILNSEGEYEIEGFRAAQKKELGMGILVGFLFMMMIGVPSVIIMKA